MSPRYLPGGRGQLLASPGQAPQPAWAQVHLSTRRRGCNYTPISGGIRYHNPTPTPATDPSRSGLPGRGSQLRGRGSWRAAAEGDNELIFLWNVHLQAAPRMQAQGSREQERGGLMDMGPCHASDDHWSTLPIQLLGSPWDPQASSSKLRQCSIKSIVWLLVPQPSNSGVSPNSAPQDSLFW